ncbi:hypothetical protein LIER_22445 [Lithospermum erythrorhizon]|uniref:Uncharacterized protein n=1 Tax=Lithospermum erythrorhizon TaxID=34254 RepID=A0AAV3QZN2_LITER
MTRDNKLFRSHSTKVTTTLSRVKGLVKANVAKDEAIDAPSYPHDPNALYCVLHCWIPVKYVEIEPPCVSPKKRYRQ